MHREGTASGSPVTLTEIALTLRRLPLNLKQASAREDIVSEGDRPSHCCLLVEGLLHRYKSLANGTRSVLAYHIPGDIPDLQSLFLHTLDHTIGAVTDCQIAMIPHSAMYELIETRPRVAAAFWRETLIDAAIFREWIVNAGSRPARPRLARLFCGHFDRLRSVGLAENDGFTLPTDRVGPRDRHVGCACEPQLEGAPGS